MINRMQLINVTMVSMIAISAQAMIINNVNNVPKFEKNTRALVKHLHQHVHKLLVTAFLLGGRADFNA